MHAGVLVCATVGPLAFGPTLFSALRVQPIMDRAVESCLRRAWNHVSSLASLTAQCCFCSLAHRSALLVHCHSCLRSTEGAHPDPLDTYSLRYFARTFKREAEMQPTTLDRTLGQVPTAPSKADKQ
jgi:hypothetical protein